MTVEATARAATRRPRRASGRLAAPGVARAERPHDGLVTDPLGRTGVTTGEAMAGATGDPARAEGSVKATIAVAGPAMKGGATGGMTGGMGHEAKSAATDPVVGPPGSSPRAPRGGRREENRDPGQPRGRRREPEERRGGPRLTPKSPRKPEPAIREGVTGHEVDRGVKNQLRTLSKENAEGVAQHLVMVAELLDVDPEAALAHAETAARRAGRVPAAREAAGAGGLPHG